MLIADWHMREVLCMVSLPDWVSKENERLAQERAIRTVEKGFKPIVKISPGVTEVELDLSKVPRQVEDKKFGGVKYFFDLINPKDMAIRVPVTLYELILKRIAVTGSGKIKIIRIGTGKADTKYEVG